MDHSHVILISLCTAIAAGTFVTVLARPLKVPAIIPLLASGILLGPEFLGIVQPESFGDTLTVLVSLAVGLILFEGGLALDWRGYLSEGVVIKRLLSIGVLVTWLGSAALVYFLLDTDAGTALLCGSLVIVTGPTVIVPLLKRLQIIPRLHNILHWEGVLIDSIGVFVALLCYEWLVGQSGERALLNFGARIVLGLLIGILGGWLLALILRREWVPHSMRNVFSLGWAVLIFGATEALMPEAGLLSVTSAGLVVGWLRPIGLREVLEFKSEITDLLIGALFILLASRLDLATFAEFGRTGALVVLLVMILIRPLNILLSAWGSGLNWREKTFLCWVAPRGIVAASMASLFELTLQDLDAIDNPDLLQTFTYSVIIATVVLQGLSAGLLAKTLRVRRAEPTGWLIVGAHAFARAIARFIRDEAKVEVMLLDTNARLVKEAQDEGFPAQCEDALKLDEELESPLFDKFGNVLALTDNSELNELVCHRWSRTVGRQHVFRWSADTRPGASAFGHVAFPGLVRPSVLAEELNRGFAHLSTSAITDERADAPHAILAAQAGKLLLPLENAPLPLKKGLRLLQLRRSGNLLSRSFEAGDVVDISATSIEEVIDRMNELLQSRYPELGGEPVWDSANFSARHLLVLPGKEVALGHQYSRVLKQRTAWLARVPAGVPLPAQPQRVTLFFFVISPVGDPEGHFNTLAELAHFCAEPANIQALRHLDRPSQVLNFIRSKTGADPNWAAATDPFEAPTPQGP